jgi:hypothetical protein
LRFVWSKQSIFIYTNEAAVERSIRTTGEGKTMNITRRGVWTGALAAGMVPHLAVHA